jgi:hypothetical protein
LNAYLNYLAMCASVCRPESELRRLRNNRAVSSDSWESTLQFSEPWLRTLRE